MLTGPSDRAAAVASFEKKFKDKTSNDWAKVRRVLITCKHSMTQYQVQAGGEFVPHNGKYTLIKLKIIEEASPARACDVP